MPQLDVVSFFQTAVVGFTSFIVCKTVLEIFFTQFDLSTFIVKKFHIFYTPEMG